MEMLVLLFILGAAFGSFLCCQARRRHWQMENVRRGAGGVQIERSRDEKSKTGVKTLGARSVCLSCGTQLKWYDNIPILSWIFLRGKCRRCEAKIGGAEILTEVLMAIVWLGLGAAFLGGGFNLFPTENLGLEALAAEGAEIIYFVLILLFTLPVGFLAIYDGLYGELPVRELAIAILTGIIVTGFKIVVKITAFGFSSELILLPISSVLILGGVYYILYLVSKGKWVGDGDFWLGIALGLVLGHPWLALIVLFLANFLACLSAPILAKIQKKKMKKLKIHFGPFLVVAAGVVLVFAGQLMNLINL